MYWRQGGTDERGVSLLEVVSWVCGPVGCCGLRLLKLLRLARSGERVATGLALLLSPAAAETAVEMGGVSGGFEAETPSLGVSGSPVCGCSVASLLLSVEGLKGERRICCREGEDL